MNKQGLTKTSEGRRTSGILQFFNEVLPEYVVPIQKSIPPYMPFEKGYGYQGVILLDTDKDRIQCHFCGRWFKALSAHIKVHNLQANEYKDQVGLYRKEGLMSLRTKLKWQQTGNTRQARRNLKKGPRDINFLRSSDLPNGSRSVQFKNRYGTCEAQIKFRFEEAIKKHSGVFTSKQEPSLASILERRFGSFTKAIVYFGYIPKTPARGGRIPMTSQERARARQEELKIAPNCKVCDKKIPRRIYADGGLEDNIKWLNKKTCSLECYKKYLEHKKRMNFRYCMVDGCKTRFQAKGYCHRHYLKFIKPNRVR